MGDLDPQLGALLIGVIVNTYLYGMSTFQCISYWNSKFKDPCWVKVLVFSLFSIDTLHTCSMVYALYVICVKNFGNLGILALALWPIPFTPIAITISATVTQIFLSYRIWRMCDNVYFYVFLCIWVMFSSGTGIACGIQAMRCEFLGEFVKLKKLAIIWLSTQMAIDAVITTTLISILLRSRTGFRSTDTIINRLIRGCLQSGLLCGIVSILALVFFVLRPQSHYYTMLAIIIGRVYTNTFMDTLLARENLRDIFSTNNTESKHTRGTLFGHGSIPLHVRTGIHTDISKASTSSHSVPHDQKLGQTGSEHEHVHVSSQR